MAEAISKGRLLVFDLDFDSDETVRSVLLYPKLAADIEEHVEGWDKRVGQLQGDFESFVRGEHISLSMTPYRHRTATMGGLMAPPDDGTWTFRCRVPKPSLRVFGKFPRANTFVALNWEPRSVSVRCRRPLGGRHSLEHNIALIEANDRWNAALPDVAPLTGGHYSDYVSENSSTV